MPRSPVLLLALALAAAACSDAGGGDAQLDDATFHLLTFSRLQGFAEGVPCEPEEVAPLAAALEEAERLRAGGDRVILGCVGDALFWTPSMTQHKASQIGARGRSEPLMDALVAAGVEVYVPGHGDFIMGFASLLDRCREIGLPVLVSNLDIDGYDDVVRDRMVVEHGGLRLGLLGLIPAGRRNRDLEIPDGHLGDLLPPLAVAAEKVRSLREDDGVDLVLIYSNLSQQTNGELAKIEGVRFVLGTSDPGAASDHFTLVQGTGLMPMRTQGRELALTTLHVRDGELSFQNHSPRDRVRRDMERNEQALDGYEEEYGTRDPEVLARAITPHNPQVFLDFMDRLEDDRAWLAAADSYEGSYVEHHRADLAPVSPQNPVLAYLARQGPATEEALERMTRVPLEDLPPKEHIPTPDTCVSCHAAQVAFWEGTDHAHAVQSLRDIVRAKDGSCLICHAAGYREPGGFNDVRLEDPLGSVTCWNCHQVTQLHVLSPRHHTDPRHFDGERSSISERCLRCHDGRRDPGFDAEALIDGVACPPMRGDDPALVQARNATLEYLRGVRAEGVANEFDLYLEARALLGLGRRAEAVDRFVDYASTAQSEEVLPVLDAASLLDRAGHSAGALRVLEAGLLSRPGEPLLNMQVVRLLLEARDPAVRNPRRAVATIEQFLPAEAKLDHRTLDMRKVQVQAYYAAGFDEQGARLLEILRTKYPVDDDLREMAETYAGR